VLFAEPLNPVRELRTFVTLVGELGDRKVLVTKSRRLKRWLSDLLDVAARSRVRISCST